MEFFSNFWKGNDSIKKPSPACSEQGMVFRVMQITEDQLFASSTIFSSSSRVMLGWKLQME